MLGPGLLFLLQRRLGAAEIHNDVTALEAFDDAVDDLADALGELTVDVLALGFADFLVEDLLGGLGGDAAQFSGGLGDLHQRIDDRVGIELLAVGQRNLQILVLHLLHHTLHREDADAAVLFVEARGKLLLAAEDLAGGGDVGVFHGLDDHVDIDALLASDLFDGLKKIRCHELLVPSRLGPVRLPASDRYVLPPTGHPAEGS